MEGLCGERWALQAQRLKALCDLDRQLTECASLSGPSFGLWRGHDTDVGLLRAAIAFERDRQGIEPRGALRSSHPEIAEGRCGPELQQRHATLQTRAAIELRLLAMGGLAASCPGVWNGLDSDAEAIARACKFRSSLNAGLSGLGLTPDQTAHARRQLHDALSARRTDLSSGAPIGQACQQLLQRLVYGVQGDIS